MAKYKVGDVLIWGGSSFGDNKAIVKITKIDARFYYYEILFNPIKIIKEFQKDRKGEALIIVCDDYFKKIKNHNEKLWKILYAS